MGAGFPLLFGGGPGSIIGGAAGSIFDLFGKKSGVTGSSGFGTQIIGSALGQILDQVAAAAITSAQAFDELTFDATAAARALGQTGTSSELLLKGIEDSFGSYEAAEFANRELARIVGKDTADKAKKLGKSAQDFGNALGRGAIIVGAYLQDLGLGKALDFFATGGRSLFGGTANDFETAEATFAEQLDKSIKETQGDLNVANLFLKGIKASERLTKQQEERQRKRRFRRKTSTNS